MKNLSFVSRKFLHGFDERLQLIFVAVLVGIGGGYASVLLNFGIKTGHEFLVSYESRWYYFLFPAAGAALTVLFLQYVVRDYGGHGVPEVIYSLSRRGGLIRFRSSFSRIIACFLTIASGGSAGPEAPVVISGSSIGSNIANLFYLKDRQRSVLVGSGAAAAIAAIFNAPVTGITFSLEAIMGEWTPTNLVPIAVASVVGTEVSRMLQGNQIPFRSHIFHIGNMDLLACIGLAALTSLFAILFVRILHLFSSVSGKLIGNNLLRAVVGGLLVGLLGLLLPDVLGEGYEHVRTVIEGQYAPGVLIAGIYVLAKILATALTIGTGGAGGIFAPCLVIGSFTGLFYYRSLACLFPHISWAGESYFGLLGMAGIMSSVLQAPMTAVFLIVEITGGYDVLISVVLVSVLSATLSQYVEPYSIYHKELIERGELLRPRTDARILAELNVMELIEQDCLVVHPEMRLRDLVYVVEKSHRDYFPVEDPRTGKFVGIVHLDDIRPFLFNQALYDSVLVEEIMDRNPVTVSPEDELSDVMRKFDETRSWSLPVVYHGRFLGLISKSTLLDYYRRELVAQEEK